ncbi:hypothetical protein ACFXHA_40945 [Nocardia sp. NPDC059240]|uniref:hypothetical protein n=1 Tax=Nocardia sp. NPDC059240 TaxID=3346786 RepID=UPI0036AF1EF2
MNARLLVLPAVALALTGCTSHTSASPQPTTTATSAPAAPSTSTSTPAATTTAAPALTTTAPATTAALTNTRYSAAELADACNSLIDFEHQMRQLTEPGAPAPTDAELITGSLDFIKSASTANDPMTDADLAKMRALFTAALATGCRH